MKKQLKQESGWILPDQNEERHRSAAIPETDYGLFSISNDATHIGDGKKYFVRTYGCQANVRDGETLSGMLELMGYHMAEHLEDADLVVFNTCAVRKAAEEHTFGDLGNYLPMKRKDPHKIFAVCGCMAQEPSVVQRILRDYPWVDLVFGTHNLYRLPSLLLAFVKEGRRQVEVSSEEGRVIENLPVRRREACKGFVNIMYGCDKFCTYCIVPYTRGRQRSRKLEDVIAEVQKLKEQGGKEVMLLGQNVNAWGRDLHIEDGFTRLLQAVAETGIERIRFYSSHPRDYSSSTIDVMARYPNIMPAIHLPVQSGSNAILKRMNRGYTVEHYKELFNEMKAKIPAMTFSTDLIVGFPGETEEEFEETMELVRYCKFDLAYAFVYSPRVGTPAAGMADDISAETKKARLEKLNEELAKYSKPKNEACVGKILKVLCEGLAKKNTGRYRGYSEGNKLVNFESPYDVTGQIVSVKITKATSWTLEGVLLAKNSD
jgi:tRNA-2-methylthio-N6-dimethylallyladenosine synthase